MRHPKFCRCEGQVISPERTKLVPCSGYSQQTEETTPFNYEDEAPEDYQRQLYRRQEEEVLKNGEEIILKH